MLAQNGAPNPPSPASSLILQYGNMSLSTCPTISFTPTSPATRIIGSQSTVFSAMGFSQNTCLPARAAAMVISLCR